MRSITTKGMLPFAVMAIMFAAIMTAPAAQAQTSASPTIGQIQANPSAFIGRVVTITGAVGAYVDRNEFLFDDGTGQIVVDPGPPWFRQITLANGTRVTITGEIDRMRRGGVDLDACQIVTPTETIQIRDCSFSRPPPWAGGPNRRGPRP